MRREQPRRWLWRRLLYCHQFDFMNLSTVSLLPAVFCSFFVTAAAASVACSFQALSFLFIRPFSLRTHRRISVLFNYAFFQISTFLLEVWSQVRFKSYGDRLPKNQSCVIVLNHTSSLDFLLGLAYLAKMGYPSSGNAKSAVKSSLSQIPLFGTILYFAEFLFLTRSWNDDREAFISKLHSLRDYGATVCPMWFVLFPEGTRLTADKLERSRQFAISKNEPVLNHVLYPRFKAFTTVIGTMRDNFDGVIDATFIYEGLALSLKDALSGKASTNIHSHVSYYAMKELPLGEEQLEAWLRDRWYEKDERIAAFRSDKSSLGTADDTFFPIEKPSLSPLFALLAIFLISAVLTIYLFSTFQNGLFILFSTVAITIVVVAILTIMANRPSKKGASTHNERRRHR